MKIFKDKVAVVTGGASGIGFALARALKAEGMNVVIADIDRTRLDRAAASLGVVGVRADVSKRADVDSLADSVMTRFGSVHLLCNNAGVGVQAPFERISPLDWKWVYDVNLWGVLNGVQIFLPLLKRNPDGGHILNTCSLMGLFTRPGGSAYASSKFAVLALTETLAQEFALLGVPVGVTAFCPGPVWSDIAEGASRRDESYGEAPPQTGEDHRILLEHIQSLPQGERLSADAAVAIAIGAVRKGEFWAITHPDLLTPVARRMAGIFGSGAPRDP